MTDKTAHERGLEAAEVVLHREYGDGDTKGEFSNAVRAYLEASGLVLVPIEPTDAMLYAKYDGSWPMRGPLDALDAESVYSTMIAAAPNPFESKP